MSKISKNLQKATEEVSNLVKNTNEKIEALGSKASDLYTALRTIQNKFDAIRNIPDDKIIKYQEIKKVTNDWKSQVDRIEADYNSALHANVGAGAAGICAGAGVVALGPTAAMGVATTFGVASTGTAISALSGAAATNAALAWLGGGALAAGGGGMAAGEAFLAMAGPVGWSIAAVAIIGSAFFYFRSRAQKEKLEKIFIHIANRDKTSYKLAIVELNERIKRVSNETALLHNAIEKISTFGLDYATMSEAQQFELGSYVNLMNSSTQLLVNPILGLRPKYNDKDFELFVQGNSKDLRFIFNADKNFYVYMCNLLYKIKTESEERELLYKAFRKNEEFLKQVKMEKDSLTSSHFHIVDLMLQYKDKQQEGIFHIVDLMLQYKDKHQEET